MDDASDSIKVMAANILAFGVSYSSIETTLRIAGLFVAFVYTCLKITQILKNWK
jgi:hypothetical protein